MGADPIPPTIEWRDGVVRMIDQRRLPGALVFLEAATVGELCDAIAGLAIRGAPVLGVAGAMGVALAARRGEDLHEAAARLGATRPTAVNLAWGLRRALAAADPVAEAQAMAVEDVERNRRLGAHGAALLPPAARVLTHCNAGALACAGFGTALGVIRSADVAHVYVDETRPVLQGARLTAWELQRLAIPATVVADALAGTLLAEGSVDCVVVGADRIAANGDVANKVGTYPLAVLAAHHGVPFYVAAPSSTMDPGCPSGADIPVERRAPEEVLEIAGQRVAPAGAAADNRAFDITPADLVTAIVTEAGVLRPPYPPSLAPWVVTPRGHTAGVLLPTTCPACGADGAAPCAPCRADAEPAPALPAPPGLASCSAYLAYEGAGREVVARLKYANARAALPWLAAGMSWLVAARAGEIDVVTWAPTTPQRRRQRGFDHGKLLATAVARRLQLPVRSLLVRLPGPPQTGRSRAERLAGPRLLVRGRGPVPACVLLVDDVATTGATLAAAARCLREAGAREVHAVVAARRSGPRRGLH